MKRVLSILIVLLLVGGIFVFVGCTDKDETPVDKLTIKFEPLNDAQIADLEIEAESTFTLPTPEKAGFVFQGWFLDEEYQTRATVDGLKQMLKEGNVTLYAKWEEEAPTALTIHYNVKGGNAVADATIEAETEYALPTSEKTGYIFRGWFFEEQYQTAVTVDGLKAKIPTGSTTVYAKWEEKQLEVRYNTVGGNQMENSRWSYSLLGLVSLSDATREDYDFLGWYFDAGYQTEYSAQGLKAKIDEGTVTVYAKWRKAKLEIIYNTKGGNQLQNSQIKYDLLDEDSLSTPTREGYGFSGWYFDENTYQNEVTTAGLKQKIDDGTVTIYAKWDEKSVTLIFDTKDIGELDNLTVKYTAIDTQVLPEPNGSGVEFQGWYFDAGYQTAYSAQGLKAKIDDGSVTLHAKWEEVTVTLRFNTSGGNNIGDMEVALSAIDTAVLPTPERNDFKFARWCFDAAYQTAYSAQGLKQRIAEGTVDLYAKWGEIMASDTITIQGKSGNKTPLNPVFDWTDANDDRQFTVEIKDADGAVVESARVTGTHFVLTDNLAYDTAYTIEITGAATDSFRSVEFTTKEGTGTVNMNQALLAVAEPFKSHMVIQRGKAINISGMTQPGALVAIDFYGSTSYTTASDEGIFVFSFSAREANTTPTDITITLLKNKTLVLEDVLIGDVYLVSGQSNVQRTLAECSVSGETPDWAVDVPDAITYGVRYYYQAEHTSSTPSNTTNNAFWSKVVAGNETYKQYSAVAFMVGAMLGKELAGDGVPVGIIYAAKGNTGIASWMGGSTSSNLHYNGMIYPLRTAEISGVVWYQGCNNSGKGIEYEGYLTELMSNWRTLFRNASLPFYVVQLPCYNGDSGNNYDFSYVRESQLNACQADENAYLIATCDGGDPNDIHPKAKRYLCERIAKSILSTVYGKDYLPQGPTFASCEIEGSNYIITVDNGEGLTADGTIVGFMLAGADGKYYDATATIENGKIIVTSDKVAEPVNVKYGFSKCPFLNIYNKDGFLMSPFRTDDHNHGIDLFDYREGAVYTYNPNGAVMSTEIVDVDGEVGLQVTKAAGNTYGILELSKWGAIGYDEHILQLRIKGSGSGAKLLFRIVEGSYEMWATQELTDNFTTVQELPIPISIFRVSSEANGLIDLQSVMRVEIIIKDKAEAVTVTVLGAKFVDYTRTAPAEFTLKDAKNDGTECTVKWGFSDFATSYRVLVSANEDLSDPIVDATTTGLSYTFSSSLCAENTTYYVAVVAINEINFTIATGSGMVLRDMNRAEIANFIFDTDEEFNTYIADKLTAINSNLVMSRDATKGLKVNVHGKVGWMDFIIKMDSGINTGFDALKIHMDLSEYKGQNVKIQLHDSSYNAFTATISSSMSDGNGNYIIPISSFVNSNQNPSAFGNRTAIRVKVGVTDYTGGDSDNIYIRDVSFIKIAES